MQAAANDDDDLQRLGQLCLPRWDDRMDTRSIRPERPGYSMLTQSAPNSKWLRVLEHIRLAICRGGEASMDTFLDQLDAKDDPDCTAKPVLGVIAAILYDQESSGVPIQGSVAIGLDITPAMSSSFWVASAIGPLFEHMLLIDYGIGTYPIQLRVPFPAWIFFRCLWPALNDFCASLTRFAGSCKNGQLPRLKSWNRLALYMYWSNLDREMELADVALMLYYYDTHRREIDLADQYKGMTGYTGVLQEMIAEVPARGSERLMRKLSVDINELISNSIQDLDMRQRVMTAAKNLAIQHYTSLYSPEVKGIAKPLFETTHQDGYPIQMSQDRKSWVDQRSDGLVPYPSSRKQDTLPSANKHKSD